MERPGFWPELRRGFLDILPLMAGVVPFGLLFGTLAVQKGLSPLEVILMCATTYAGGAQFVSIDVWATPVPVFAVVLATALANTRYFLMGAALRPHVRHLPFVTKAWFVTIHSDETWALAIKRCGSARLTPGYVIGLTVMFYLNWPISCAIGAWLGSAIENPARFGADFMFVAMFLCLIRGMWQGRTSLVAVLGSALCALVAHLWLPGHWYIFIGALGGMSAVALVYRNNERAEGSA
ncbi:MAG TPA: branched-chain amino acid ABC transporter permease [Rhodospirillaceae bacterium]|nr:branched-chain amino acid ABC transporter permease [Rhodospirillaceae bacterium]MAX62966.1 branched-chain amino acid ABC transporter permease [Rhodospirillaceae bacterium]MBB57813.1 branched-chain amino acid ABC transporter permease [Rhodospirillaceae bacterium]HAE02005.1 branched-chain amino acid ABC transporter permease [Rhodospirillaceae bacterium]HAJ21849.1 branched-chain amino acid ABC transporter permease [Rhodospirillaceae bacterium]|tara:strand:+ start:27957 stop:28667 length:711 start_codon:yes stop_codon:yes gene_type:complete